MTREKCDDIGLQIFIFLRIFNRINNEFLMRYAIRVE